MPVVSCPPPELRQPEMSQDIVWREKLAPIENHWKSTRRGKKGDGREKKYVDHAQAFRSLFIHPIIHALYK